MKQCALEFYACPECQGTPTLDASEVDNDEVVSGTLSCRCGAEYKISRGIPRFCPTMGSPQQDTADDYGLQWTKLLEGKLEKGTVYGVTRDDWKEYFQKSLGLSLDELRGKRILDAGCGSGKLARALAAYGCQIVSLDIHSGLDAFYALAGKYPGSHIAQGDASQPPIAQGKFDVVWASGMIHRTRCPHDVFQQLAKLVAEDGRFFVWVCRTRRNPYRMIRSALPFARKLPSKSMYLASLILAVPLYVAFNGWYLLGKLSRKTSFWGFKQSRNRHRSFGEIALTVFDIVGPEYLHAFREEEITSWFEEAGFDHLHSTDDVDIGICGRKKAAR